MCLIQLPVLLINQIDDTVPISLVDVLALSGWCFAFVYEVRKRARQKCRWRNGPASRVRFGRPAKSAVTAQPRGLFCF